MNSNYGRSNKSSFDFDLGLNSNNSKSLNDQKNKTSTTPYYSTPYSTQSNKPSWTHQPAPPTQSVLPGSLSGPTSMVGDITGRSWANSAPASKSGGNGNGIGIVNKNPNLFGDLVGPALGKGSSNVPLKNLGSSGNGGSKSGGISMGGVADSLPKSGTGSGGWGFSGGNNGSGNVGLGADKSANFSGNVGLGSGKSANLGGPSMKSSGGSSGMNSNKDPFGSLLNFGAKQGTGMKAESKGTSNNKASSVDDGFGDFQKAPKPNVSASNNGASVNLSGGSYTKMDDFGFGSTPNQPPVQPDVSASNNDFDVLFSSPSVGGGATGLEDLGGQQSSGIDGWDTEFGGGNDMGGTTELEGLPPPPSGVTAAAAKNKGMENYKQGQFPDAIKWLSWAVVLFGKASDNNGINEVLSNRASCYKEVGEYKKAVADCTKVLEHDKKNVSALVQRALLYESMEKYKLGAEDLRTVMRLDPGNRVARSTVHRLTKMAEG